MADEWSENARLPRNIQGPFTCRKSMTWDKRLCFPSEGRRAEEFFALKNPTDSASTRPLDHRNLSQQNLQEILPLP